MKPTIEQITNATRRFAAARLALITAVQSYDDAVQQTRDRHWPGLQELAGDVAGELLKVTNLIDHARELFDDPRTIIVDGIKVGLAKGRGGVDFEDETKVIAKIEKLLPGRAEELVKTEKSLKMSALKELPAADLARIGVKIESVGDQVVIKPIAGEMDKLVKSILKEAAAA